MRISRPAWQTLCALVLTAGLAACEEGIPPPLPESQVSLSANPTTVNSTGGTVTLTATVTNDSGPVNAQVVTFAATFGTPNPASATTNSSGIATSSLALVNPPAQVTATATAGELGSDSVTITVQ
jgi:hypothetical protein